MDSAPLLEPIDVPAVLKAATLFAGLAPEDLDRIAAVTQVRRFDGDEAVFSEGDPATCMYVIAQGRVSIVRNAADGQVVRLAMLRIGDFFGEMAIVESMTRSATARAHRKPALLLEVDRGRFRELLGANPDLSLRILACVLERLRQSNKRVVEVDHEARKYAPTLSERVTREYPHPIAVVFREMETAVDSLTKLQRLFETMESCLLYLRAVCMGLYLRQSPGARELDAEIGSSRFAPTLGALHLLVGRFLDHFDKGGMPGLPQKLHAWYSAKERDAKDVEGILRDLRNARNLLKHGSEASLDEHAAEKVLGECAPKFRDLLESLSFLRDYPLVYIQGMAYGGGIFRYTVLNCMGAFRSFHSARIESDKPFETEKLYVRDGDDLVPLTPWMELLRCGTCGDREAVLIQVWTPQVLKYLEFARGHRTEIKEVSPAVAKTVTRFVEAAEEKGRG